MANPTLIDDLAREWEDENTAAGPDGAYSFIAPEKAEEDARWWLAVISRKLVDEATELERERPDNVNDARLRRAAAYRVAVRYLRSTLDPSEGEGP